MVLEEVVFFCTLQITGNLTKVRLTLRHITFSCSICAEQFAGKCIYSLHKDTLLPCFYVRTISTSEEMKVLGRDNSEAWRVMSNYDIN